MNLWPWSKEKPNGNVFLQFFCNGCFDYKVLRTNPNCKEYWLQKSSSLSNCKGQDFIHCKSKSSWSFNSGTFEDFPPNFMLQMQYLLVCYVFKQITDNFLPILLDHFFNFMYTRFFQFVFILGNYRALSAQWQSLKMCTNLTFLDIRASYLHF